MTKPHQKTKKYEIVSELNELYHEVGSIHKKLELLMNKISHMATGKEAECRNKDIVKEQYFKILEQKRYNFMKEEVNRHERINSFDEALRKNRRGGCDRVYKETKYL